MTYLLHPSGAFAACEDPSRASRYEARGYERCDHDSFRAAWRMRDELALAELWPEATLHPPEQQKEVGGPPVVYVYASLPK